MDHKTKQIHIEKIRLLYIQSIPPSILSAVSATSLSVALWHKVDQTTLLIWAAITVLSAFFRIAFLLTFKDRNPQGDAVLSWERPYTITLFMVFLIWGVGLPVIAGIHTADPTPILTVTIFAIGIACGASSWYSGLRHIQIGAIFICLLPMIAVLLSHAEYELFWVGIAASFLFFSCISSSLIQSTSMDTKLELAYDLAIAKQEVEAIANTDLLTGLNNRRAFFEKSSVLLNYCRTESLPISLILFDIDFFKKMNDGYGHAAGDVTLQHVANLLQRHLRKSDISCRFGGEEFVLLLPNTVETEALITAEKIRSIIEKTPVVIQHNKEVFITASFGVCGIGDSMDELLSNSDEAMYTAKREGRNNVKIFNCPTRSKKQKTASNKNDSIRTALVQEI